MSQSLYRKILLKTFDGITYVFDGNDSVHVYINEHQTVQVPLEFLACPRRQYKDFRVRLGVGYKRVVLTDITVVSVVSCEWGVDPTEEERGAVDWVRKYVPVRYVSGPYKRSNPVEPAASGLQEEVARLGGPTASGLGDSQVVKLREATKKV